MISQRELCLKCFRAQRVCYCSEIKTITPKTKFVILRHKLERKRTIGTAQMTRLSLSNCTLITDCYFEDHPVVKEILESTEINTYVLFPGENSISLDSTTLKSNKPTTIFVIDGTWLDAKQILRLNPNIAKLQKVSFHSGKLSEYRFRKQPEAHCLSTIESIHRVLELIEPTLDAQNLLHIFRHMVKLQVSYTPHLNP